jgi:hypothetical protein
MFLSAYRTLVPDVAGCLCAKNSLVQKVKPVMPVMNTFGTLL